MSLRFLGISPQMEEDQEYDNHATGSSIVASLRGEHLRDADVEIDEFVFTFIKEAHPLKYIVSLITSGLWNIFSLFSPLPRPSKTPCVQCSADIRQEFNLKSVLSIFLMKLLILLSKPFAALGEFVEYSLNVVTENGGLKQTLIRLLRSRGRLPVPPDDRYYSFLGFLDKREDLHRESFGNGLENGEYQDLTKTAPSDSGNIIMAADLCMMASKLAYENEQVVRRVVNERWKMHFDRFYDCWNEYLENNTTQAFTFTDTERDANAVVVAFRGTSPFNMLDWCTDFDFSWYTLPEMGKVHVGFLEALGLGSRNAKETFRTVKRNATMKGKHETPLATPTSGLPKKVLEDTSKVLAFDEISSRIRMLLRANLGAKLYITGHSLGGALSALFTALLLLERDYNILKRLEGVFTFGQPRVGDETFARYMERHLCSSEYRKYFRFVYCNDIVPRIPFDDQIFGFKHFGLCHYYDSTYEPKTLLEEPLKNLSVILYPSTYMDAIWELVQSLLFRYCKGEEYWETGLCLAMRIVGLFLPGISAHNPVNYVNAIRLGSSNFKLQIQSLDGAGAINIRLKWRILCQNYRQIRLQSLSKQSISCPP